MHLKIVGQARKQSKKRGGHTILKGCKKETKDNFILIFHKFTRINKFKVDLHR